MITIGNHYLLSLTSEREKHARFKPPESETGKPKHPSQTPSDVTTIGCATFPGLSRERRAAPKTNNRGRPARLPGLANAHRRAPIAVHQISGHS